MALASGFNAVIYETIPCLHDLTGLNFAMNTLDFSGPPPNALRNTVARFERECWRSAPGIYNSFMNGRFGAEGRTFMEERMAAFADDEDERKAQLAYMGSVLYQCVLSGLPGLTPIRLLREGNFAICSRCARASRCPVSLRPGPR